MAIIPVDSTCTTSLIAIALCLGLIASVNSTKSSTIYFRVAQFIDGISLAMHLLLPRSPDAPAMGSSLFSEEESNPTAIHQSGHPGYRCRVSIRPAICPHPRQKSKHDRFHIGRKRWFPPHTIIRRCGAKSCISRIAPAPTADESSADLDLSDMGSPISQLGNRDFAYFPCATDFRAR